MTILHVTPCLAPTWAYGRVAQDVDALARAQAAAGHDVIVLTTDALAPHERLPAGETVVAGVRVVRVRNVTGALRTWLDLSSPFGFTARARALFAQYPIDIVHLHELTTVENIAVLKVVPPGLPIVISPHGKGLRSAEHGVVRRWWDQHALRRIVEQVHGAFETTETELEFLLRRWTAVGGDSPRRTAVIPRGITPITPAGGDAHVAVSRDGRGPSVLFVGRLTHPSGLEPVLRAVAHLRGEGVPVSLLVAGGDHGGRAHDHALAHQLGLDAVVTWLGYVPPEHLHSWLARVDVMALPVGTDPYGDVAITALSTGVTVLVAVREARVHPADRPVLTRVHEDTGSWHRELAAHLSAHTASDGLRRDARATASRYGWDAIAAMTIAEYREVIRLAAIRT